MIKSTKKKIASKRCRQIEEVVFHGSDLSKEGLLYMVIAGHQFVLVSETITQMPTEPQKLDLVVLKSEEVGRAS